MRSRSKLSYLLVAIQLAAIVQSVQAEDAETSTSITSSPTTIPSTSTSTSNVVTEIPTPKPSKPNGKMRKDSNCASDCVCQATKIICEGKKLKTIPNLSKFANITEISLRNNSIEVLDFNLLPLASLEVLDVSSNLIKSFINTTKKSEPVLKLRTLNLRQNDLKQFTNYSSWKFPNLEELDLSSNKLEELTSMVFNNSRAIQTLRLEFTNLKSIHETAFLQLKQLKSLNMTGVKLVDHLGDKQFAANQRLETLDLTNNGLVEIPFALRSTASIKTLVLNENLMTSLRQSDFINRSGLINLEIRRCIRLTKIDEFAFSELRELKHLIVADNPKLQFISKDAFKSGDQNHSLEFFDISGNNLTTLANIAEFTSLSTKQLMLNNNPWNCNCDLKWIFNMKLLAHCDAPSLFKDMEVSQYFATVECFVEETSSYTTVITIFLLLVLGVAIIVLLQRNEVIRRLLWKDQYGTIYYTKASFPSETV